MSLAEIYNYWLAEQSNPISREWPLLSLSFLLFVILAYTYFVVYAGPRYIKDRQPYKLKNFILFYNIIQILANTWIVQEHIAAGWFTEYGIICKPSNLTSPNVIRLLKLMWWIYLLKIFDLVETCIFVLRKKQNQVSTLHVYHHVSNVTFLWHYLKYVLDERASLITLVNCTVHIIMYTYYLLAALNWKSQTLHRIKPLITRIQMVQFIGLILYVLQVSTQYCKFNISHTIVYMFAGNLLIFLYLFYDFYKKSYNKVPKQKKN